jgi:hypothetical protein
LLPPTLPEREGWVQREKLLALNGRNRKPQIELAIRFGIDNYAQPAGGCCFLTDRSYANKLTDFWKARGDKHYELDDIMLLKVGRHLRPRAHFKLIVGRDEGENNFLSGYRRQYLHLYPTSHKGALVLLNGEAHSDDLQLAARLTARFSQGRDSAAVSVAICDVHGREQLLTVRPLTPDEIPSHWYL